MTKKKFKLHTIVDIQEWSEPSWLIKDIIPKGGLTQIFGKYGCGKTFVVLDWALSIATGKDWGTIHTVEQGPVIYAFGEGKSGLKRRINAWLDHHGVEPSEDIPFYAIDILPQLAEAKDPQVFVRELKAQLQDPPSLIIIDTLARATVGADENASQDMGKVMHAIDRFRKEFNCTTIIVHHSGHKESDHGRGSSVVPAALDAIIQIEKKNKDLRHCTLKCEKAKDADKFDEIRIELAESKQRTEDGKAASLVATYGGLNSDFSKKSKSSAGRPKGDNELKLLKGIASDFGLAGGTRGEIEEKGYVPSGSLSRLLNALIETIMIEKHGKVYNLTEQGLRAIE